MILRWWYPALWVVALALLSPLTNSSPTNSTERALGTNNQSMTAPPGDRSWYSKLGAAYKLRKASRQASGLMEDKKEDRFQRQASCLS
eukprot:1178876-Prorocentrum_minimum.AAC.1